MGLVESRKGRVWSRARFAIGHVKFSEKICSIFTLMHRESNLMVLKLKNKEVMEGTKVF